MSMAPPPSPIEFMPPLPIGFMPPPIPQVPFYNPGPCGCAAGYGLCGGGICCKKRKNRETSLSNILSNVDKQTPELMDSTKILLQKLIIPKIGKPEKPIDNQRPKNLEKP